MPQDVENKRVMIDLYEQIIPKIHDLMNKHNRSTAYVANVLIQEALVERGKLKEVTQKL